MKRGIAVTGRASTKLIEKLAIEAEKAEYDYFLVTDHFMLPNSNNHIDVWSFLPYLAAKTESIRLGTAVTPLPFRPPAMFAKMVATTDYLSGGRVILGVGFGWYQPEFEAYAKWYSNRERIAVSLETIDLMKRLWTEPGLVDYNGKYVHATAAGLEPKPIQKPFPPIWWGGHLPVSLRTAGKYADGWMPIGPRWFNDTYPKPAEYLKMRKTIVDELRKRNYPENNFAFTTLINNTDIPTLRRDVEQYREAGMTHFTLGEKAENEKCLKDIATVAKEIGGSF